MSNPGKNKWKRNNWKRVEIIKVFEDLSDVMERPFAEIYAKRIPDLPYAIIDADGKRMAVALDKVKIAWLRGIVINPKILDRYENDTKVLYNR